MSFILPCISSVMQLHFAVSFRHLLSHGYRQCRQHRFVFIDSHQNLTQRFGSVERFGGSGTGDLGSLCSTRILEYGRAYGVRVFIGVPPVLFRLAYIDGTSHHRVL